MVVKCARALDSEKFNFGAGSNYPISFDVETVTCGVNGCIQETLTMPREDSLKAMKTVEGGQCHRPQLATECTLSK